MSDLKILIIFERQFQLFHLHESYKKKSKRDANDRESGKRENTECCVILGNVVFPLTHSMCVLYTHKPYNAVAWNRSEREEVKLLGT